MVKDTSREAPGHPLGGMSLVAGRADVPLLDLTVPEALKRTAARFPDGLAAVFCGPNVRWTWAELDRKVDGLAIGLMRLGLAKGERIGIW